MDSNKTNEQNCIISTLCTIAGVKGKCHVLCPHWITIHGATGEGGRLFAANIPRQYMHTTLANSPVEESQPEAYAVIEKYVESFKKMFDTALPEKDRIKSLYLCSHITGTGKTTTAIAIGNEYLKYQYVGSIKRGLKPKRRPVYFMSMNELQTLYSEATRPNVPKEIAERASGRYYENVESMKNVDLLVFDDIGLRSSTEAFTSDIHSIINYRNTMIKPTVYTSNIPLQDIGSMYSKQIWDRTRDMCLEIAFSGESKRGFRR
ncbi:IstB-like ATP binding protein [Thermoactinomyces sp. DSM 45891]|uniref:ATP-binding protein n=1 Tax=Thermoactinomyces sp. DSM 45891 TaxID=1761907 RepID=UPI000914359B|nr:ATP-binding protein [Thermoactinomyces sp. DSM 45891]SFX48227.1 IstB-like ATP binding protein [Thermoactinomyces sp. DSM 45891]